MINLPEIEGYIWINIRGQMRSIPSKGYFITTVDENGGNYPVSGVPFSPVDTYIFKDGVKMDDVQGFSVSASIDDLVGPTLVLVIAPKAIEVDGMVEQNLGAQ